VLFGSRVVYFETRSEFTYLGDPEKAKRAFHPKYPGAATLGDVGYIDKDGYLFLTDRFSFKINSGGNDIIERIGKRLSRQGRDVSEKFFVTNGEALFG
jgi:acyl-coenzyme A synthetase/AMP-(fatty) acid ligase